MFANMYEYTQKEIRKSLPCINALMIIIILENILLPFPKLYKSSRDKICVHMLVAYKFIVNNFLM